MLRKLNLFFILGVFLFSLFFISSIYGFTKATNVGNVSNSLNDNYAPGDSLVGWINISLKNEPTDSFLTVFNNSVRVLDILTKNNLIRGIQYNCSVASCNVSYSSSDSGASSLSFTLNSGQKKVIGFKIPAESVDNINNLFLNISSTALAGCSSPIKVDMGNDGTYDWIYNKPQTNSDDIYCSSEENYGCYQSSTTFSELTSEYSYCQYINVSAAAGFRVGAEVSGSGNANLTFSIDNSHSCSVLVTSSGKVGCNIYNLSFYEPQSLFVCVSKTSGSDQYKIFYDTTLPICGEHSKDFSIFVKAIKYDSPGYLLINSTNEQTSFAGLAKEYLDNIYGGDCSDGCFIPISFYSSRDSQQITVNNGKLNYVTDVPLLEEKLYNLIENVSKINMKFTKLNISGLSLKVPAAPKNYSAVFKIGGTDAFTKNINVLNFPTIQEVYPLEVPVGANIYFTVLASSENISSYKWSFGDNSTMVQVSSNHISHKYNEIKKYNLTVYAVNSFGETSKSFQINAISPKTYLPIAFDSYKKQVSNIRGQTSTLPALIKGYVEKKFDLPGMEVKIATLESKYRSANSTPEYIDIANSLLTINLPANIVIDDLASGRFLPSSEKAEIGVLKSLTNEDIEGLDDSVRKALAEWSVKSISVSLNSQSFSAVYGNTSVSLGSYFNVKVSGKPNSDVAKVFAVISKPKSSLEFSSSGPSQSDFNGSTGISLDISSGEKSFDFIVLDQKIIFLDAPIYFSPLLSELSTGYNLSLCNFNDKCDSGENSSNCRADCRPWGKIILWFIILLIAFLIAYIACQEWYKRRYEDYLFKDKNELFNLIHFMSNAEKQGLKREEVFDKLREKGWHSEQIIYAYRKFKGERTGMMEIPLFGLFDSRKINREVDLRNKIGLDPKVIPRPLTPFVKQPTFFGKPIQKFPPKPIQQVAQKTITTSSVQQTNQIVTKSAPVGPVVNKPVNNNPSINNQPNPPKPVLAPAKKEEPSVSKPVEQKTLTNVKKEEPKK